MNHANIIIIIKDGRFMKQAKISECQGLATFLILAPLKIVKMSQSENIQIKKIKTTMSSNKNEQSGDTNLQKITILAVS